MFGFFFRRKPAVPLDPPSDKQRRYAKSLGIEATADMRKRDVSAAINSVKLSQKFGAEIVEAEKRWNEVADSNSFILAVYTRGKSAIADVLQVNGAYVTERGKLKLEVSAPKAIKDRYIGTHLEWDRAFELPVDALHFHEPMPPNFYEHGRDDFNAANKVYQKAVERGLKIAKKFA